jgi:hypothetical protein
MLKYGNSNIFLYLSAGVTIKENCCHAIFKNMLVPFGKERRVYPFRVYH